MPTPKQLLTTAKASLSKPAMRKPALQPTTAKPKPGGGSSTLYREGAPGPKVKAKPDPNAGIGGGQSSGASGGAAMRTYPGFKPKMAPDGVNTLSDDGRFQTMIGAGARSAVKPPPPTVAGGQQTINMEAPVSKPVVQTPPQPAWQQLAAMGVGGQGSAAANQAKLRELQAQKAPQVVTGGVPQVQTSGGPAVMSAPPPPDRAAAPGAPPTGDQTTMETGGGTVTSFPGFKPRPGFDPAARGLGGGLRPPLGSAADPAGAVGGMGAGSDGDFSAFGGGNAGGGFGDLARVGAGVAARRRFPQAAF